MKNLKKLFDIIKEYLWALNFAFKTSFFTMLLLIILFCLFQLAPLGIIYINQYLISIVESTNYFSNEVINAIIILLLLFIVNDVGNVIYMLFFEKIRYKIGNVFFEKVIKKINSLPPIFYDNKENQVLIDRIKGTGRYGVQNLIASNLSFFSAIINFIIYIVLISFNAWYMVFIMLSFSLIPYLFRMNEVIEQSDLEYELAENYKRQSYYGDLLFEKNVAKEIRISNYNDFLIDKWNAEHNYTLLKQIKNFNKWNFINHFKNLCISISRYIFLGILLALFINKKINLLQFTFLYQAQGQLQNSIKWFCQIIPNSYGEVRKLDECKSFINNELLDWNNCHSTKNNINITSNDNLIELHNVNFSYDASDFSLKNISMSVPKNKIIAILGDNGSGKSTLIKIILGLYNVNSGEVIYNNCGQRISYSCSFQDYCKYELKIRENIGFGDISHIDDDERIINHLEMTDCKEILIKSNNNIDNVLGKLFDNNGIELSEGQWERVANSRTLFNDSDIYLFDEPSAKLDPLAELAQFEKIMKYAKSKTTIFVSHRIGFAKNADYIYVLKNGEIIEQGTHDELLSLKNEYFNMYTNQKKWYLGNK